MTWFEVDRQGLMDIAKRRGIAFIVTEPIQNAWDEVAEARNGDGRVDVELTPVVGRPLADLSVLDNAPDGFRDLADSYRMFRTSYKLANPEQRGRFNIGEKLLLAAAIKARITSTTGSVIFDERGRRRGRKKTKAGSLLEATIRMTRAELEEALRTARTLIPPPGVKTVINGETLPEREPIARCERSLETEIAGEEGGFKYTTRKTEIRVYEPHDGETPHLYEMGIPIDKVNCPWHIDVGQKVPLSVDRGSVRHGYVLRVEQWVAEIMAAQMTQEQARDGWVSAALPGVEDDDAVRTLVKRRFGKAVTYDPSSPEANKRALDAGYHVVRGGELSKAAWRTVRGAKALKPAGQVFKVGIESSPDGVPPEPRETWTPQMEQFAFYAAEFAESVGGREDVAINFYRLSGQKALAFCRPGEIGLNLSSGGTKLLDEMKFWTYDVQQRVDDILIHECAHFRASDHLSDAFHRECTRLGAKLRLFHSHLYDYEPKEKS